MILLLIACTSCKAFKPYKVNEYLNILAYKSGIDLSQDIESSFNSLLKWNIVDETDYGILDSNLNYAFLSKTISNLINGDFNTFIIDNNFTNKNSNELVNKEDGNKIIDAAIVLINNPIINNEYSFKEKDIKHISSINELNNNNYDIGSIIYLNGEYKKISDYLNGEYILANPSIEDVFYELNISGTNEINLDEATIIPYGKEDNIQYLNNNYQLLVSNRHTFTSNGFRIAYSFNSSGIDIRISKTAKDKMNMFFDISLSNIKPSFKWKYKDGKIDDTFFKLNYKLTSELGVSTGKYSRYYLDFKDLDSSSFLSSIKSSIKTKDDEIECTIPICKIKTPIPSIPIASINIDVVAKIYASGRVEIVMYNSGTLGFEVKSGKLRLIHDVEKDSDFVVGASTRAVAGINFNLEAANFRLFDIELDGGIRAAVTSTLHLYDEDEKLKEEETNIPYSILEEISKENKDVRICGDISLNWVLDLQLNTSKSILNKYGLTYKKSILDSNNQVFNNLTHIENWQFVKKCTRKKRTTIKIKETTNLNSNKIVLNKYSQVVINGKNYQIEINSMPSGYTKNDLIYTSSNNKIAEVIDGIVYAKSIGSTKIEIKTNDDKYKAYINILVSTG